MFRNTETMRSLSLQNLMVYWFQTALVLIEDALSASEFVFTVMRSSSASEFVFIVIWSSEAAVYCSTLWC